jgi:hypothetical protein
VVEQEEVTFGFELKSNFSPLRSNCQNGRRKGIDANDPALTLLGEDVARLALDNQSVKAESRRRMVRIDSLSFM